MSALAITPAYQGTAPELDSAMRDSGLPWTVLHGHSDLPRARSILFTHALKSEADVVLAIDADNVPSREQIVSAVQLATPGCAVYGFYEQRDPGRISIQPKDERTAIEALNRGEPFEIEFGGLGFAAFHRESLERVAASLEQVVGDGDPWWPFCVPICRGSVYLADDRVLCHHLRMAGVDTACHPSLRVKHSVRRLV